MGSPDLRQIDGLGGAEPVKSKVAIIDKSSEEGIDIDYYFAQVKIDKPIVDTKPSCGNIFNRRCKGGWRNFVCLVNIEASAI